MLTTRAWWAAALIVLSGTPCSVGAASSSSSYSSILASSDCRDVPYEYAVQKVMSANACSDAACQSDAMTYVNEYCGSSDGPCPSSAQIDLYQECSSHSRHTFYHTFQEKLKKRQSMMWNIFFLVLSVLLGAFFRMTFPFWLPYTVGLLLFGILSGIVAQRLAQGDDCPMYALKHDHTGDGYVSHDEWEHFLCVGCANNSYCLTAGWPGALEDAARATCGDGSASPAGCWWSFDFLDSPWKLSLMHAEAVYDFPSNSSGGGGHRMRSLAAAAATPPSSSSSSGAGVGSATRLPAPAGDGQLSADELWTTRCNLFIDMISLKDIDPHMMLVVFLPALLFESACFGIDMGIFLKQLPQILLMAFPSMIVASGLTAVCLYYLAPPSWTFWVCWLIGVITSATDPVAVVALLKELGASKTLGTLIEGESLLNDGSAVVLFVWVRNAIGYDYATLAPGWMRAGDELHAHYSGQIGVELLRIVAQMCFLGGLLGWLFGFATKFALKFVYNDRFVEASIIIGMSYLLFWLGELVMGSSAVLAVVVMGLYMNYNKSCISPGVLHFLHEFYEMVAHVLNTVIFLIAGCKLGALAADGSVVRMVLQFRYTWSMIILMYPIVLFARGAAIALAYPLLKRLGTGCTWKEAIIMWWGGLRGSVGLALGLAVHHMMYDKHMWGVGYSEATSEGEQLKSIDCRDQPVMVLGLTMVVVTSTVVLNGVTMAPLMRLLKLTKTPDDRNFMLKAACQELEESTSHYVAKLKGSGDYELVDWQFVEAHIVRKTVDIAIQDADKAAWLLVLNLERAYYYAQFEDGVLSAEAFAIFESFMANLAADAHFVETSRLGELYDNSFYRQLIEKIRSASFKASLAYEIGLFYLAAQDEVRRLLQAVDDGTGGGGHGYDAHTGELRGSKARRSSLHGLSLVALEHEDNVNTMRDAMQYVETRKPEAVSHFQTHHATMLVLHKQGKLITHMLHEGELLDLDAAPLSQMVDERLKQMYVEPLREKVAVIRHAVTRRRRPEPAAGKLGSLHSNSFKLGKEDSSLGATAGDSSPAGGRSGRSRKNGGAKGGAAAMSPTNLMPAAADETSPNSRCTHGWFAQGHKNIGQLTGGHEMSIRPPRVMLDSKEHDPYSSNLEA